MNQDQVKGALLSIESCGEDFTITFTGKQSRKVDGLYRPQTREILLHNKNFTDDRQLVYTAIHEYAHHLQFTGPAPPASARAHTRHFWSILHRLLAKAEEKGIYENIFKSDRRFRELTERIKATVIAVDGALMKEFGALLLEAHRLCAETRASFEDYVDRELLIHRHAAKTIMKVHRYDLDPAIGFENMKTVAGISDETERRAAQEAFREGQSPDMVRERFSGGALPADPLKKLLDERERVETNIERLTRRLAQIEREIGTLSGKKPTRS